MFVACSVKKNGKRSWSQLRNSLYVLSQCIYAAEHMPYVGSHGGHAVTVDNGVTEYVNRSCQEMTRGELE